jgi:hypothetical protein
MEPTPSTSQDSFRPYIASAIILFVIGWGAVALAILALTPTVWARWLLFFGGTLGLTGLALPATWFLNLRFASDPPAGMTVILRQAIWVGVYGALLVWLQQERLVSLWTGLGLAAGLTAIEYAIRMRERARWRPVAPDEASPLPGPAAKPANGDQAPDE